MKKKKQQQIKPFVKSQIKLLQTAESVSSVVGGWVWYKWAVFFYSSLHWVTNRIVHDTPILINDIWHIPNKIPNATGDIFNVSQNLLFEFLWKFAIV